MCEDAVSDTFGTAEVKFHEKSRWTYAHSEHRRVRYLNADRDVIHHLSRDCRWLLCSDPAHRAADPLREVEDLRFSNDWQAAEIARLLVRNTDLQDRNDWQKKEIERCWDTMTAQFKGIGALRRLKAEMMAALEQSWVMTDAVRQATRSPSSEDERAANRQAIRERVENT